MSYTREQLDSIKRQAGLTPYEKRLGKLELTGSECRTLCPWHEKTGDHIPSLAIFESKDGTWAFKCMSKCEKKKGDVFNFVQFLDGVTFAEAVRRVASESGLSDEQATPKAIEKPTDEQYEEVRQYLISSGIPLDFAKNYTKFNVVVHPKLGLAVGLPYDADEQVIKYRAIHPKDESLKFSHALGHKSKTLLYNIRRAETEIAKDFCPEVFVVESERDCLTMEAHGFTAVSVSSASTCIKDGVLQISEDQLKSLAKADYVFAATDQDPAGEKCADAFEQSDVFNALQVRRISWPYRGKQSKDPKDIGDLYLQDPAGFRDKILTLSDEARMRPPKWRQQFSTVGELDDRPIIQLVEGFLTEGNIGIGGLSGSAKTFTALSITKALTTKRPFVGKFPVPEIVPVLYLVPEVGDRQFRHRLARFGIPDDENLFLCRTLSKGTTLTLDNPWVIEAVRQLHHPVVILDTAIRFSKAKDENAAAENRWMEENARTLREAGAIAVILLHHSTKRSRKEAPSLESAFRGSGDIGALFDIAYHLQHDPNIDAPQGDQVTVTCVKPRDFEPPKPFNLGLRYFADGQMRSYIEETGDLVLISDREEPSQVDSKRIPRAVAKRQERENRFLDAVADDPTISLGDLCRKTGLNHKQKVSRLAARLGWKQVNGEWEEITESPLEELKLER